MLNKDDCERKPAQKQAPPNNDPKGDNRSHTQGPKQGKEGGEVFWAEGGGGERTQDEKENEGGGR